MNTANTTPTFSQQLKQFFFAEEIPYGFALMRIVLPMVLLRDVLARWRFSEELYSTNGVTVALMENYGYYNYMPPLPPFWAACLLSIEVLALLAVMIGWHTRVSLVMSLLLHVYFSCNDMASSMTKFTVISAHVLLLLSLSNCGGIWSVDSWLARRRDPGRTPLSERPAWALAPVWPHRLLLIMIGATYLGAAITKLHMPEFITGEAISYWIMSNPNFRHFIGEWMTQYPGLLVISGHFTVLWEILFVFLAWKGFPRIAMFALGLFFHFMAALTLGEVTFLTVMISCYLGCLTEQESRYFGSMLSRLSRGLATRLPVTGLVSRLSQLVFADRIAQLSPRIHAAAFCGLLLIAGLGGAWANHELDLYGERRPEGPYELQTLSEQEVSRLFTQGEPIRESDKFLAVKVGSMLVSGRLANVRDDFRYDDIIVCEASLNPPHEDMWIECHLLDEDNKIIHRDGTVAAREARGVQFRYQLTDALVPGTYSLLIRSRGQEICRQKFTLEVGAKAPVAN